MFSAPRASMLRSAAAMLISCVVVFSAAEYGARLWADHYGNALNATRSVLEADDALLWKQRANLDMTFLSLPLTTNEAGWRAKPLASLDKEKKQVLILGPSSTFGWGVRAEDTYASKLASLMQNTEVINAGEIGYSSAQGVRLFAQAPAAALSPAAVVIAYGVNDLDRSRFYFQSARTDAEEFTEERSAGTVAAINHSRSSALVDALLTASSALRMRVSLPPLPAYPADPVPRVRVSPEEFAQNTRDIVAAAKARGTAVVLISTHTALPAAARVAAAEDAFSRAQLLWEEDADGARKALRAAVAADPHLSEAWYYLASLAAHTGDASAARSYFSEARAQEPYRISRDLPAHNEALRLIAEETGTPLVDIGALFANRDAATLFVDPIHFSAEGNALVAAALASILQSEPATR